MSSINVESGMVTTCGASSVGVPVRVVNSSKGARWADFSTNGHLRDENPTPALVCLTALCLSVPVLAQGELSLEGLSEQLQALTNKGTALTERVDANEALWGNLEQTVLLDGSCIMGGKGGSGLHAASVLSYEEWFDEWPDPDYLQVLGMNYNPETDVTGIQYRYYDYPNPRYFIIEFWQGCEFVRNTDW